MKKARFLGLPVMAMLLIVGASCAACGTEPDSPAPRGTPLIVRGAAVYLDNLGRIIPDESPQLDQLTVAGVEITVTDADGNSQNGTTTHEEPIPFEMLAEYDYTIIATYNGTIKSTQATVTGYYHEGGAILVGVWKSNDTIEDVHYGEPVPA